MSCDIGSTIGVAIAVAHTFINVAIFVLVLWAAALILAEARILLRLTMGCFVLGALVNVAGVILAGCRDVFAGDLALEIGVLVVLLWLVRVHDFIERHCIACTWRRTYFGRSKRSPTMVSSR